MLLLKMDGIPFDCHALTIGAGYAMMPIFKEFVNHYHWL